MMDKMSTFGSQVLLTVQPDCTINSLNLSQTELLLNHMMTSSVLCIVVDLDSVSWLDFRGICAILQFVSKANDHGRCVYLANVQPSIHLLLDEAGIFTMASLIETKEELESALRGNQRSTKSTRSITPSESSESMLAEGYGDSTQVSA